MEKYMPGVVYMCKKCGSSGGLKGHHVSFLEERKEPSRYDGGPHPEMLVMTCERCDATIGRFSPLDTVDPA